MELCVKRQICKNGAKLELWNYVQKNCKNCKMQNYMAKDRELAKLYKDKDKR